jgi:hypothetical protein
MCYVVLQTVMHQHGSVVMLTARGHAVIEHVDGRVCAHRKSAQYDGTDNHHTPERRDASMCASISVSIR